MPLFAFYCRDGENGTALRTHCREAHLAHLAGAKDDYALAGPLKDGDEIVGSLLVIKADDEGDARRKFEADPYFEAGVWQSIRAAEFLAITGDWVGESAH